MYRWELPKTDGSCGLDNICRFKGGGLPEKRGVVFLREVDTQMHTMLKKKIAGGYGRFRGVKKAKRK